MSTKKSARHLVDVGLEEKQSTMTLFIKNHTDPQYLYKQIERLYGAGDVQEAAHVCACVIDAYHPLIQHADFFVLQAKILFEVGDDLGARGAISQALMLESHHATAQEMHTVLEAQELLRDGLYTEGEAILRRILKAQPIHPQALFLLGHHLLWKNGPEREALELFENCLQIRPRFLRARLGQAHAYKKIRDFAKAEVAFAECLRIDHNSENHEMYKKGLQNM